MAGTYNDAQKRASLKYQKAMAQVKITITKEQREQWQNHAKKKGVTLTALITELIENDMKK